MWYTIGRFTPDKTERLRGTHIIDRWCLITGPHYRRVDVGKRRDMCIQLATDLARHAGYDLEAVISVTEAELQDYVLTTFPWLLMQSTFWDRGEK